jgi:hypothetical protein
VRITVSVEVTPAMSIHRYEVRVRRPGETDSTPVGCQQLMPLETALARFERIGLRPVTSTDEVSHIGWRVELDTSALDDRSLAVLRRLILAVLAPRTP